MSGKKPLHTSDRLQSSLRKPITSILLAHYACLDGVRDRGRAVGSGTIPLFAMMATMCNDWHFIIIADADTKSGGVNVTVPPKKKSTEDRLGTDVENTIEDSFRIWRDNVAALGETPSNWIQEPEENSPDTADSVGLGNVIAKWSRVSASDDGDRVGNPQEGDATESVVTELKNGQRRTRAWECIILSVPCRLTEPGRPQGR